MRFLTERDIKKFKNLKPPMTELGEFVFIRTYSRWLELEKRRETWLEVIVRVINYSLSLEYEYLQENNPNINFKELKKRMNLEARQLLDNMFYLRQFASGRTMWVAGTEIARKYPLSNFNCAFMIIDSFKSFKEMFYLLMLGSGVGFRTMHYDVKKIPSYRTGLTTLIKSYEPVPKKERLENTKVLIEGDKIQILVGDSKEGWVNALDLYFQVRTEKKFSEIKTIEFNFDSVRPKGEKLKRFGGRASGHESIEIMFTKIGKVLEYANGKLKPINVMDISNIIAENVVSGGVRRSSQINLSSVDEIDIEKAKNNLYTQGGDGEFILNPSISHRRLSNNSIFYEEKPSREQLRKNLENMRYTGERGIINAESARKRRDNFEGVNPCGEIALDSKQVCNLTTNNVMAFIKNGKLMKKELLKAFALSTRIGIRMTLPTLELPEWNEKQIRDRLIGVSMTGWFDMIDALNLSNEEQNSLLRKLRKTVRDEAKKYSAELGINEPLLATTIKPEGTISQLPTVSSGVHRSHSPYFIRRIRVTYTDPVAKMAIRLGYPVYPEAGQSWENCNTVVVEFPIKSPVKKTKFDVTAIEQLETYKAFQENYTEHNTSITVTVKEHEWNDVEQWVWDNWDSFIGISFLPLIDAHYPLAPYEAITEEEYKERKENMKSIDLDILNSFDNGEELEIIPDDECVNGACPVR